MTRVYLQKTKKKRAKQEEEEQRKRERLEGPRECEPHRRVHRRHGQGLAGPGDRTGNGQRAGYSSPSTRGAARHNLLMSDPDRCPGQLLRKRSGGTPSGVTQFVVAMNKLDAKRDAAVDLLGILGFLGLLHPLECASSAWGSCTAGRRAPRWPGA